MVEPGLYPGTENRDRLAQLIRMARDCRAYDAMGEINDSISGIKEALDNISINVLSGGR